MCRMKYGDIIITKMTTTPYKVLLLYLTIMSCQSCGVAVLAQYDREDKRFAKFDGLRQAIYDIVHSL